MKYTRFIFALLFTPVVSFAYLITLPWWFMDRLSYGDITFSDFTGEFWYVWLQMIRFK